MVLIVAAPFPLQGLVELLETRHYAKIGLTLGTVIFSFAAEDPSAAVRRVPAEVAGERRPVTCLGTMTELFHGVWRSTGCC